VTFLVLASGTGRLPPQHKTQDGVDELFVLLLLQYTLLQQLRPNQRYSTSVAQSSVLTPPTFWFFVQSKASPTPCWSRLSETL